MYYILILINKYSLFPNIWTQKIYCFLILLCFFFDISIIYRIFANKKNIKYII